MIGVSGTTISLPRGDTGPVTFPIYDPIKASLTPNDRAVFAIYDKGEELLVKVLPIVDDAATVWFANEDTQDLEPSKDYRWDLRIVANPVIETDSKGRERVTDGTEVNSPFAIAGRLPKFKLLEVGVYV